jgi:hypothetical protein
LRRRSAPSPRGAALLAALFVPALAGVAPQAGAQETTGDVLELAASTERSDTGSYRLSWSSGGDLEVTLEEATRADFTDARTLYRGVDGATVVSGRFDGVYHYRARRGGGAWSAPVTVTVAHHSLAEALAYLAVGAVVFVATVALIVGGHRRHRREHGAGA